MKKTVFGILLVLAVLCGLGSSQVLAQSAPLASFDLNIVGLTLKAEPEYQAVPKGIATQVNTFFDAGGYDLSDIVDKLPQDFTVRAELSGPAFQTPLSLTTRPGQPFDIPTLALFGKHTLSNIHLADGEGKVLFGAEPQVVTIESIDDPLITEVKTRPLTLEELEERGVTFDSSNFDAYEFTAVIATESGQVPLDLPVLIPTGDQRVPDEIPQLPPSIGLSPPSEFEIPPQLAKLPDNFTISGFSLNIPEEDFVSGSVGVPPISGILVIPGNIGFLHQYFSAMAIVTNGAPGQSNLVVKDLQARLILPEGEDLTAGTDDLPGDDPIRMAKGADGFFPRQLPIMHPGADGSFGTSDDFSQLFPAETGQADFTIEGLKEGTHKLDFEITATLEGLPIGPVPLTGHATGAVLVRNPDFSVTMGHPDTVRSGELYDLFVTITNTGKSIANLVSVNLDPRALSGAVFAGDEDQEKQIETILPGSSATVKYRLVAQRTGKVTASAFASEDVKGRFVLRTGVGENGVPLSPDSLILPYIGDLPSDLVNSVVGLLGQAWSVATAPSGALPADVLPISKRVIGDKANSLSEAGLRILLGDTDTRTIGDLIFELLGSDERDRAFDSLRRGSTQGKLVNGALGAALRAEVDSQGLLDTQGELADLASYREAHISVAVSDAPVHLQMTDLSGARVGGLNGVEYFRELPYADRLIFSDSGSSRSAMLLATRLESSGYEISIKAEDDARFDLGLVLPDAEGMLRQLRFAAVDLAADGVATLKLFPGATTTCLLEIDRDGDGVIDASMPPSSEVAIFDRAPRVVAATQIVPDFGPGGDEHGRTVAVLFSERVSRETAEDAANYLVEANGVRLAYLQPGGRMAFILLKEGIGPFKERSIAVENVLDGAGQSMLAESRPITITAAGPAARLKGVVRLADGTPVPDATIRLQQPRWVEVNFSMDLIYFIIAEKTAASDGSYSFDYVLRHKDGPFRIEALHPLTEERAKLTASVAHHDQDIQLDLFMKARGNVTGIVRDVEGSPVPNAPVLLNTLVDNGSYYVTADGGGNYAFAGVGVGPFSIKANSAELYAEGNIMGLLPDEGGSVIQDVIIYPLDGVERGDVAGRVTDADGSPRAGVIVDLRSYQGKRMGYRNWMYSGADGSFSFSGVYAGDNVHVDVRDDATGERGSVSSQLLPDETAYFNVILQGTGSIGGLVKREDRQSPEGMVLSVSGGQRQQFATLDATGTFFFSDLKVGTVTLELLDPKDYSRSLVRQSVSILNAGDTQYAELNVPTSATVKGMITGTVYRLDGSVAVGAEVRQVDFATRRYIPYQTDENGRFEIPDLNKGIYSLIVRDGREICNKAVEIYFDGQIKEVELRPFGLATVSGTVYDEGSDMMPVGSDVSLFGMQPDEFGWLRYSSSRPIAATKSDPQNGTYSFRDVYQGVFSVAAQNVFRPSPAVYSGEVAKHGELVTADLVLKDSFGSVSGRVLLPDGSAAGSDIRVSLFYGGTDVVVTTDEDGLFAFEPIIPARRYQVTAEDRSTTLLGQSGAIVRSGNDTAIDIRLLGRGSMRIKVLNADGSIEPGAEVNLKGTGFPFDTAVGSTDAEGFLTLANLSEGRYAITATGSAARGGRVSAEIVSDGASAEAVVILAAYGRVTGTFMKADGLTPVPGGQITLKVNNRPIGYAISSSDPATLGQFQVDYVPLGAFTLEGYDPASDRTGRGGGQLVTDGGTLESNVVIVSRGTVRGTVLNFSGTAPVGKASVTLTAQSGNSFSYTQTVAPDGSFLFSGVPEGQFDIRVIDPETGLRGAAQGSISFEGDTQSLDIRIAASGFIEGVVLLPDGSPAVNAGVQLSSGRKTTVNPADGSFRFVDLPVGRTYSVFARETGTNRAATVLAALAEDGEVARTEIVLAGIGTIEGRVYDTDGVTELSGATVRLAAKGAVSVNYTLISDQDGFFRFTGVPVSDFSLNGSHPGLPTAAATSGTLQAEGDLVTVTMQFGDIASVRGQVLLPDGITPARGGAARFYGGGRSFVTVIDSDGFFEFNKIPLCSFNLSFEDQTGTAIGKVSGVMTLNGEVVDAGTIVLDDKPITVVQVTPADGMINVPVATDEILIKFSEPADIATITSSNIRVLDGSRSLSTSLHLDADGSGVRIALKEPLVGFRLYTLAVSGLKDLIGWPMAQPLTSTFTTIDNIPPVVESVSPANGSVQTGLDAVVRVTFSEPVMHDSLQGIRLLQAGFAVETQLDLIQGNRVAVLTPVNRLQPNKIYTFEVSGVVDGAGNPLAESVTTVFSSLDTLAPGVTELTVDPAAVLIEGLEVEVGANVDSVDVARVDFYRENELVASDYTAPFSADILLPVAGTNYLKAIAEDAVGNRGTSTMLELEVASDQSPTVSISEPLSGVSVASGGVVYVSVVAQDDVGLLNVGLSASGSLELSQNKATSGKEQTVDFSFTLPLDAVPGTEIVLKASATDLTDQTVVSEPVILVVIDATAPNISLSSPGEVYPYAPGASGLVSVGVGDNIGVMELACVASGAASGEGSWILDPVQLSAEREFVFELATDAAPHAEIGIDCTSVDASGNSSTANLILKTADLHAPLVVDASLQDGTTDVPLDASLTLTFDEPLAVATINDTTVLLTLDAEGGGSLSGQVDLSPNGRILTYVPTDELQLGASYLLTLSEEITDLAGNALGQDYLIRFTTLMPDVTPPRIVNLVPGDGAAEVSVSSYVVVTFDEPVVAESFSVDSLTLSQADESVVGSAELSADGLTLSFKPAAQLAYDQIYSLRVKAGLADNAGNIRPNDELAIFRTSASARLLKAVYYDPTYATYWISRAEAQTYRNFLVANGFISLDAARLQQFMIENGPDSIVVMAQDVVPDTVATNSPDALIRQYMNRGGSVVWSQYAPFYYHGMSNGGLGGWGNAAVQNILDVPIGSWNQNDLVTLSDAGIEQGLAETWRSYQAVPAAEVTTVLASDDLGQAAAWFKNYNTDYPKSGFYRLWDYSGDFSTRSYLNDLLAISRAAAVDAADSGLVAKYHADGNWFDASGNGLDGATVNGPVFSSDSKVGYASGEFGSTDAHVEIGNLYGKFPDNTYSIEAWVKLDDLGAGLRRTIAGGVDEGHDFALGLHAGQFVAFVGDGSTMTYAYSGFSPNIGEWYHLAATYDDEMMRLYVNGELRDFLYADWRQVNGGVDFWLGNESCCLDNGFNGLLDEVAIYNRALSDGQVLDHYNGGVISGGGYPAMPSINQVESQWPETSITITGTKDVDSAIFADGVELVPVDGARNWSVVYSTEPGKNVIQVYSRNQSGNESARQAVFALTVEEDLTRDYDGDGMTNGQEVANGTDPLADDAYSDPDQDGLTHLEELSLGTDLFSNDSDQDGLNDGLEVRTVKSDPLLYDTDGDSLSDGDELNVYQSSPLKADTDGDILDDGWEVKYQYDPTLVDSDGNGVADQNEDPDGDGLINRWEYLLGFDPTLVKTDGLIDDGQHDSDRDGWINIDEVQVHFTDPSRPDTDGDGVIDTDEKDVLLTDPNNKGDLYGTDLVLDGQRVRMEGTAVFNTLTLRNGAVISHLAASAKQESGLDIQVAGAVEIDATSSIDVTARGYLGGRQPGNASNNGRTLVNTAEGGSSLYAGGSYGGQGGLSTHTNSTSNQTYGDLTNPNELGSGGSGNNSTYFGYWGGNGGGLVRLSAGALILDGSIVADGGESVYLAAGSGGGVRIDVGELSGAGRISAQGGDSINYPNYGGGGGGRIAVYYDVSTLPLENIDASGGSNNGTVAERQGGAGTIYLKSSASQYGDLIVP
jgi:hypothetical protein